MSKPGKVAYFYDAEVGNFYYGQARGSRVHGSVVAANVAPRLAQHK